MVCVENLARGLPGEWAPSKPEWSAGSNRYVKSVDLSSSKVILCGHVKTLEGADSAGGAVSKALWTAFARAAKESESFARGACARKYAGSHIHRRSGARREKYKPCKYLPNFGGARGRRTGAVRRHRGFKVMDLQIADFNDSARIFQNSHAARWQEVETALRSMPLHLKASDQNKKQGSLIFDPVGTNTFVKESLEPHGWQAADIADEYSFLGLDVDFARAGVILEAQFSNYPFLLNNLLRSELFFREKVAFAGVPLAAVIMVVKAGMFPASNSTLYYEQALAQLNGLAKYKLFSVPMRLVGLFSPITQGVEATFTTYSAARYSRTVQEQIDLSCDITRGRAARCKIKRAP